MGSNTLAYFTYPFLTKKNSLIGLKPCLARSRIGMDRETECMELVGMGRNSRRTDLIETATGRSGRGSRLLW